MSPQLAEHQPSELL